MKGPVVSMERENMKKYWKGYSHKNNFQTMMLDNDAERLSKEELPQIMGLVPDITGKDVVELGAGVGRYTQALITKNPASILAVDFIPEFYETNKMNNGKTSDIVTLVCEDVTLLNLPSVSKDFVFSNWLLMYLTDEEVRALALNILKWLKPGGHTFFRESCFKQSGDTERNNNPTYYRNPSFYIQLLGNIFFQEEDGSTSYFELVSSCSVAAYRLLKKNHGQICFLWVKRNAKSNVQSFQSFLDEQQYSAKSIRRYEKIFGPGYLSTGGHETTKEFVAKLRLNQGDRVLDVGCGIGGGDFYMAEEYGASVTGIDLSSNMVHVALERAMLNGVTEVDFEICDAMKRNFPEGSFDAIYSRDTILHIENKSLLFSKFLKWLKPGGRLLISDYCCGDQNHSDEFKAYVAGRNYHLLSPKKYGELLTQVGFKNVVAEDRTEQFQEILKRELRTTVESKNQFVLDTCEKDYDDIVKGWEAKLNRCAQGDQKWGLFTAAKST